MDIDDVADPDVDNELQVHEDSNDQVFQPFPDPDDPDFDLLFNRSVFHIVRVRQIHSRKHTPTCFKYRSKKCRFRFPRKRILTTMFDEATGIIHIKRDHPYLNNYNKWFSIMTRGNHDVQFLFTKNHALAIVYYIMKYISKPEAALHSKLTVCAAMRKTMTTSPQPGSDSYIAKMLLLKTYNKLDSLREVGVPEAISHLLKFRDHYTNATFVNIHTTHVLRHMRDLVEHQDVEHDVDVDVEDDEFNSEIVVTDRGFCTVSLLDDYACRGPELADYCLYDYCAQFYKRRKLSGLPFDPRHPQHAHYSQFLRKTDPVTVPTLLGKLLFVKPDSEEDKKREDYYCLIASIFFPWSHRRTPKSSEESWEQFVEANQDTLSPRIRRMIYNLTLLHKSKEETRIHQMQLRAQEEEASDDDVDGDDFDDSSTVASGDSFDDLHDDLSVHADDFSAEVEEAINNPIELGLDFYAREGLDACRDNGYLSTASSSPASQPVPDDVYPFGLSLSDLQMQTKRLSNAAATAQSRQQTGMSGDHTDKSPHVFLTDGMDDEPAIMDIIHKFTLNEAQQRVFRIVAYHTLGRSKVGPQLRLGVFGEGGTGKSRLIAAIRAWFAVLSRQNELVVTAPTGTAAFNVAGITLHSAGNLPIGKQKKKKIGNKRKDWTDRQYLIVDEVSMMDCKMLVNLDTNLKEAKHRHDDYFGGINIIFMGDFLQLATVSHLDVYVDKPSEWEYGHQLWRSINLVVLLTEQMRQSNDPPFAAALRRIRFHEPTFEDIEMLNSRIGAPLECPTSIPIIVRRHKLRDALNNETLQVASQTSDVPITHCLADIKSRTKMSRSEVYNVKGGRSKVKGDGILSVIPGAPLMITDNIDIALGLVNGAVVEFYGFADSDGALIRDEIIGTPPAYMLVKLKHDVGVEIALPGLPPSVVGIEPVSLTYKAGLGKSVTYSQFPVTLAYAITDYKCQGQTFRWVVVDLKKPNGGYSPTSSPYVQLSRAKTLASLSILRPFNPVELRTPLSKDLIAELEWQAQKAKETDDLYM